MMEPQDTKDEFDLVTLGDGQLRALRHMLRAHPSAQRITPPSRTLRTSARVSISSSATTPRAASQAANSGRQRRMTTPAHCTFADSIRDSSTP